MTKTLSVNGMSCGHCVAALTKELKKIPGVEVLEVSLEKKSASIEISNNFVTDEALQNAVEEAGFDLVGIN